MKKENKQEILAELEATKGTLDAIKKELANSEDFILSYIKVLALVHGGKFDLNELAAEYKWKLPKIHALSAAIAHFAARGFIKKPTVHKVELK